MFRRARGFAQQDGGAIAPLVAIGVVALAMVGALAWDVGRGYAMRAEMDAAVDAAALAGATQLDGKDGATARALKAAQSGLVKNGVFLGTKPDSDATAPPSEDETASTDITICFKEKLSDTCSPTLADDKANFIQVDALPKDMGLILGALASTKKFQVVAHAVAGYGTALCKVPPIMLCNPNEDTDPKFETVTPGLGISMLAKPAEDKTLWYPGNFGWLEVDGSKSSGDISDAVARVSPLAQCYGKTVNTAPGDRNSIKKAIGVRFDLYTDNKEQSDPNYMPAMNTIIGQRVSSSSAKDLCDAKTVAAPSNKCDAANPATAATGMGLPPDCDQPSQAFGTGKWDVAKYFDINHHGFDYTKAIEAKYGPNGPISGMPTRYQVYNWEKEILASLPPGDAPPTNTFTSGQSKVTDTADFARPMCYKGSGPDLKQLEPDRRTISVVLVNCKSDKVQGGSNNVNVIGGLDIFLLAPAVDNGANAEVFAEVIQRTTDLSAVGKETRLYSVRLYE